VSEPDCTTIITGADENALLVADWFGAGPPILYIHGLTNCHRAGALLAETIAPRRRFLALDLRGRGDSAPLPGGYGLENHARDIAVVLEVLGIDRVVLAGFSLGSYTAVAGALECGERVAGVALIDGGIYMRRAVLEDPRILEEIVSRLGMVYETPDRYVGFWRSQPFFEGEWNAQVESTFRSEVRPTAVGYQPKCSPEAARQDQLAINDVAASISRLEALRVPVLAVVADHGMTKRIEATVQAEHIDKLRAVVADTRVVHVPDTTHQTIVIGARSAPVTARAIADFADEVAPLQTGAPQPV
jgi:pimeloyl-ACP methyl ester carboxylesterase